VLAGEKILSNFFLFPSRRENQELKNLVLLAPRTMGTRQGRGDDVAVRKDYLLRLISQKKVTGTREQATGRGKKGWFFSGRPHQKLKNGEG